MRLAFSIIATCLCFAGYSQSFTPFSWPVGVSNSGPYTLASVVSNSTVFMPSSDWATENDMQSHKYNHHTKIAHVGNTTWIAFSSASTNESDGGMQCALAFSTNRGANWSDPIQAVPSQSQWTNTYLEIGQRISYPRNFTTYGGTTYLICAVDQIWTDSKLWGATLFARSVSSNGTIGTLFSINPATYTASNGVAEVAYDPTLGPPLLAQTKIYGTWGGSYGSAPASDWIGWLIVGSESWVEPNVVSADGSSSNLFRLWRQNYTLNGVTNVSQQYTTNGGTTWSSVEETSIPNDPSETAVVRLTNGQFAILGNPCKYPPGNQGSRDPLFLATTAHNSTSITNVVSVRSGISSTPTYAGYAKLGGASYVDAVQVGNYLYVSYSIYKESIGFSRVLIPGFEDNNNDLTAPIRRSITTMRAGSFRSP